MAKVSKLAITLQNGTDNTYFASWAFGETTKSTTSSTAIKKGSLVSIKSGATEYYNGVSIPSWVKNEQWYIVQLKGDRAVLGKNKSGSHDIQSPINTKYLITSGSSSSTTTEDLTKTLDHYKVTWYYATGNGLWFESNSSDTKNKYLTYNPPENARKIKVTVKPVAKTYKKNNKDVSYWSGTNVSKEYSMSAALPKDVSAPSVKIEKFTLTATIDNISDERTDKIQFEVYDNTKKIQTGTVTVKACKATYTCTVAAGGSYRVRCRSINLYDDSNVYGTWSSFSSEESTIPKAVTKVKAVADSKTSVKVTWTAASTAKSYMVEYATKKEYFDSSTAPQSITVTNTYAIIEGMESGKTWFFRVKAVNDKGDSSWSSIVSTVIGTKPEAPTTWSLTSSVIVGEEITLYWTHNCEDGSKQVEAEININGEIITIDDVVDEDEDDPIYTYTFGTQKYSEGTKIRWMIRTKSVTGEYGDWSTLRTIDVYAPPSLELTLPQVIDNILKALPLEISLSSGPTTQNPISYHVAIIANDTYESVDIYGNPIFIAAGAEVYSKVIVTTNRWPTIFVSAGDIILENNQQYTLTATVSMDSGLTAESSLIFTVEWEDREYTPDASIAIDFDTLSAYITPFCKHEPIRYLYNGVQLPELPDWDKNAYPYASISYSDVTLPRKYTLTILAADAYYYTSSSGSYYFGGDSDTKPVPGFTTTCILGSDTWDELMHYENRNIAIGYVPLSWHLWSNFDLLRESGEVYSAASEPVYDNSMIDDIFVENVTLSVYRREYNGSFTTLATDIPNDGITTIPDPHPSLDYARYRIVAVDSKTGGVVYEDLPGVPIGEPSIVVQWDETWSEFDYSEEDAPEIPPWTGSMIRIPYNVDVTENQKGDVALIEYIGREHPVSYYGTQRGTTASWSAEIPKSDKEMLYALRRLASWRGDVYVREPSGTGYWANITVSFPLKHLALTIPVTFDIARVEGGV